MLVTMGGGRTPNRSVAASPAISQAPGDLVTVQAFVNTLDIEQSADELTTPEALSSWLAASGLAGATGAADVSDVSAADFRLTLSLREALRGVLRSHAEHASASDEADVADGPVAEVRRIAATLPTRLEVGTDGRIRPAPAGSGVKAALARILLITAEAATLGTWTRLKACSADDCQWAFYDRSPTRNGCWCTMQICGSRAKSRAYRQREVARRRRG
jgi:predicted RNA-binding Zn ribbon-like protein